MTSAFKQVGLIGKSGDPRVTTTLQSLISRLAQFHTRILLDESVARLLPDTGWPAVDRATLAEQCDLAIVVGGDGTLLNAARWLAESEISVLGVNLGRLGFLVDVLPEDMEPLLEEILTGNYLVEERALLHAAVSRDGEVMSENTALNDVIVHKKDIARLIELDTWIDGNFLSANRADGLIAATPTGSTAYALSGGGPILHPGLQALTLVPICPHTLSNRPIVIPDRSVIEIRVHEGRLEAQLSCDGQVGQVLRPGDRITLRRHDSTLRLLHPPGHDFFSILRKKLRWSEQP
ncbi:MAG: NAD(+) kinase [Gammaproteobacteria bacterium]|jgi:NAD+ kinase